MFHPLSHSFLKSGTGKTFALHGVRITVKASADSTGGVLTLTEYHAPPRFPGPPPHFHRRITETFYVLSGALTLCVDGATIEAAPGDYVIVPPGVVHAFRNASDHPTRFLATYNPGGMERYFEELFALMQSEPAWPAAADFSQIAALARRYDTYPPDER